MTEPLFRDRLKGRAWGVVPGLARKLNKHSRSRGCPPQAARFSSIDVPAPFGTAQERASLAFGTAPGKTLSGEVLTYPGILRDAVLTELDRREGWHPDRGLHTCGYLRDHVTVHVANKRISAVCYLSNPEGDFHVPSLTLPETAAILLHATPAIRGQRALGWEYAADVLHWLRAAGQTDPYLETLEKHVLQRMPVLERNRQLSEK